jgi:hypothetical protein
MPGKKLFPMGCNISTLHCNVQYAGKRIARVNHGGLCVPGIKYLISNSHANPISHFNAELLFLCCSFGTVGKRQKNRRSIKKNWETFATLF